MVLQRGRGPVAMQQGLDFILWAEGSHRRLLDRGVAGLERHFMEMTLVAYAWDWRLETGRRRLLSPWRARTVEGNGEGTDLSQI